MADSTPTTNAVIVEPVPAGKSRTLFWTKVVGAFGFIVGLAPQVLELFVDPQFMAAMNKVLPEEAREWLLTIATIASAIHFHNLRKRTAGPIAESQLAQELAQSTEAAGLMSMPTSNESAPIRNVVR